MVWVKAFHIVFVITWFAGLFYLPRLFVYHSQTNDKAGLDRFVIMERRLYRFTTPSAVLAITFGLWLWLGFGFRGLWLDIKVALVALLAAYHIYLGVLGRELAAGHKRSPTFYRVINEIPVLILIAIVILVVVRPSF
ncbi:CopD family protein [Acidiferrobacter sp.]|uniref:CopD family protein n=1 Tax=Acidiferrobacter sp. TaxID=1872107 RepID=UPI00261AC28C|nr:CopD family protein [Acidiferrobacter sp.]